MKNRDQYRVVMLLFIFSTLFMPIGTFGLNQNIHSMQSELPKELYFEKNLTALTPGDIAFKHPEIFPDFFPTIIDHCLLFVEFNTTTGLYVFIEAAVPPDRVQYKNETESALTGPLFGPFAKVKHANTTQKQNAIDFAKRQIGKPFQGKWINKNHNPEDIQNDPLAGEWYCSELIWAAYYNCNHCFPEERPKNGYVYGEGIDLDRNGWENNFFNHSTVSPREILRNRSEISIFILRSLKHDLITTCKHLIMMSLL